MGITGDTFFPQQKNTTLLTDRTDASNQRNVYLCLIGFVQPTDKRVKPRILCLKWGIYACLEYVHLKYFYRLFGTGKREQLARLFYSLMMSFILYEFLCLFFVFFYQGRTVNDCYCYYQTFAFDSLSSTLTK